MHIFIVVVLLSLSKNSIKSLQFSIDRKYKSRCIVLIALLIHQFIKLFVRPIEGLFFISGGGLVISKGSKLRVLANYHYKNHPEKNVDILLGETRNGKYQQFQVQDVNQGLNGKVNTGYAYVRAFTNVPLKVGDYVTVKEILAIIKKYKDTIIHIKIEETMPGELIVDDSEVSEEGVYGY